MLIGTVVRNDYSGDAGYLRRRSGYLLATATGNQYIDVPAYGRSSGYDI
jgi:hypothetical protein